MPGIQFNGTQSYMIDVSALGLTLNITGIANNSSVPQTIRSLVGGNLFISGGAVANTNILMSGAGSDLLFATSATALNANIVMSNSSNLNMLAQSTLGVATVTMNSAALNFSDFSSGGQASVTLNNGALQFNNYILPGTTIGSLAGSGTVNLTDISNAGKSLTIGGNNQSTTFSGQIFGRGSIVKEGSGTLTLTGNNAFQGGTTINAGTLAVNGSLASLVIVGNGGNLSGTGLLNNVIVNGAISPGNSIGTINVTGNYIQNPGSTYQVEVGSQSDLIRIFGGATINGGTVAVQAGAGARATTYTIVTATDGVTGTYQGLTSNLVFVTPSLSYDANNVFLTLRTNFAGGVAAAAGPATRSGSAVRWTRSPTRRRGTSTPS